MQYVIVKNPDAKTIKFYGSSDWCSDVRDAVKFKSYIDGRSVVKNLATKTAAVIPAGN